MKFHKSFTELHKCEQLWNSINDLWKSEFHKSEHFWNSINDFWNSINTIYSWNSINDLWNSINDLWNSIKCSAYTLGHFGFHKKTNRGILYEHITWNRGENFSCMTLITGNSRGSTDIPYFQPIGKLYFQEAGR